MCMLKIYTLPSDAQMLHIHQIHLSRVRNMPISPEGFGGVGVSLRGVMDGAL